MTSNTTKIMNGFNTFFESNETYTRKELLEFAKKNYDDNYKKTKKVVDENAIKKPLNAYQLFMKEQRIILNKRESERTDGEKKKSTELMKEIAEMWKIHKANNEIKKDIKEKEDEEENVEENKKEIKKDSKNKKEEENEEENVEENKKEIKKDSKNKKEEENEEEDENLINSKADTEKNDDENKSKLEKKPSKKGAKWTNL
jgi:DnaJ family protein A protein 5